VNAMARPIDRDVWAKYPYDRPVEIVTAVFGDCHPQALRYATHEVVKCYPLFSKSQVDRQEKTVRAQLERLTPEWQFITIEDIGNRFRPVTRSPLPLTQVGEGGRNTYGLAPVLPLDDPPATAFRATRSTNAESCLNEGIEPSDGQNNYPDTKGKLYFCRTLNGPGHSAKRFATLLSDNDDVPMADYSILEVRLDDLPSSARIYQDAHSESGIIVDRFNRIPPSSIVRELRFLDGSWIPYRTHDD
jgi:hypothetical protein